VSLADFDERELDLLADYLAGTLEPSTAIEVARLVRTDRAWADAYRELAAADRAVAAQLRAYGMSRLEPMPADVIDRVDAALATAGAVRPPAATRVISLDAARRTRRRRVAQFAAAAAVLVAVGAGVVTLNNGGVPQATSAGSGAAGTAPRNDLASRPSSGLALPFGSGTVVTASGTDYTAATLARAATVRGSDTVGNNAPEPTTAAPVPPDLLQSKQAELLGRLTTTGGLAACITQVVAVHPGQVTAIDYARYESTPALIVTVRQPAGSLLVVAVGAECGLRGADELASARA
jgi:hypothetical protein